MSLNVEIEPPSREEELARLVRALRLARGFKLYFARSLPGEPRRALLDELDSALGGSVRVFDAERGLEHLRSSLEFRLAEEATLGVVCVSGIETWVPAGDEGAESTFVRNLNASRDRFAQTVPCPMVIWGADHVLRAIQHGAPDFFSVASGIYLFPTDSPLEAREKDSQATVLAGTAVWLRDLAEIEDRLQTLDIQDAGTGRLDRIGTLNRKVVLLLSLGRFDEAGELAGLVDQEARQTLGAEHPDTLTSVNNLAYFYELTGRYAEAEPLYVATLEASRRVLGPDHSDTLRSANNLAGHYELTGRYAEAEPLYAATLEASRRVLGPDHPDTLRSVNNLAYLYESTGRYAEAEPLYVSTLETRRRVLGPEHPDTLAGANNLAYLYVSMSRYAEAEPLYVATLEANRRVLGPDHPNTLSSANNLAYLYKSTGRTEAAIHLLETCLDAVRRLPEGHKIRRAIENNYRSWTKRQSANLSD